MLAPNEPQTVEFTVPGEAVPWARAGGGKTVIRFTPKKQRSYMAVVKDFASRKLGDRPLLDGPLELSILYVYPWPKSVSERKRAVPGAEWKISRPDGDNLDKIIKDALNNVVWTDDARVAAWHGWKKFGDKPCVKVRIVSLVRAA